MPLLVFALAFIRAAAAEEACIPSGSALFPTLEKPLDSAQVEAKLGPALASLVGRYGPMTYSPDGGWSHWVEPIRGPTLPNEVRLPVQAPAPLTATLVIEVGARKCLGLQISRWEGRDVGRNWPTWNDGQVTVAAPLVGRIEVAWHGRTVAKVPLADVEAWQVVWDADGAVIVPSNVGCGPFRLTGPAQPHEDFLHECVPDAWMADLARGTWRREERAAILKLLSHGGFEALPIEAATALVARADLTAEERTVLGVPEKKSGQGVATIRALPHGRSATLRVAVDGVEATGWTEGPEGRSVKVPARGLSMVTVQSADSPVSHWAWEMWLGDGSDVTVSLMWGPKVNAPDGARCGRVVGDGEWTCGSHAVRPEALFRLPCGGPPANGELSWISLTDGETRQGTSFVAAVPGLYEFAMSGTEVTVSRIEGSTCTIDVTVPSRR